MAIVRILVFVAGLSLVGWTLITAVRTVVLPRASRTLLAGVVFRGLAKIFNLLAGERATYARRDRSSPTRQQPRVRRWGERLAERFTPSN